MNCSISLLPVNAFKANIITRNEAIKILEKLLANNYYLSSRDYKTVLDLLDKK